MILNPREIVASNAVKPEDAETLCQYLSVKRIPYKKKFTADFTGAHYALKSIEIASQVFEEISTHPHIARKFDLALDAENCAIITTFKDLE